MVNGLDASTNRFLAALSDIESRASNAERKVSSGKLMAYASDAPDQVSPLLLARARLLSTQQVSKNLNRAEAELNSAEAALSVAVSALERANQLGVQGASSTQTVAQRYTDSVEVQGVLEHLVSVANTTVEGRYVFSGDLYHNIPYTLDLAEPNGVSVYGGSDATRQLVDSSGVRFTISRSAQELFDDPAASAFGAVNQLRLALLNGPTVPEGDPDYSTQYAAQSAAIDAALLAIKQAQTALSNQVSYYGTVQNRMTEAINTAKQLELRQTVELSNIEDADIAVAATELTQAETHRDAALSARSIRMNSKSLFDYIG
jgi:flagellar hook-associated protein 3 FlgL